MSNAKPELKDVLDNLTEMPSLPTVVAKITRLIADPKTTASDINDALSSDPGLVTKILKLVNSSYYGFPRRITTITNAVVILGFNQVRNLALSTFIFESFANAGQGTSLDINGFWKHSIGAAFFGSNIARLLDPKMEEDAFICGLLHDLGKFVMAQNAKRHIMAVVTLADRDDILFYQAEPRLLAYDHAQLGAAVMEQWNLPETLVEVVRCHQDPEQASERAQILASVTNLADISARAMLMGNAGDRKIPRLTQQVWDRLGMDWQAMDVVIRKVADEYSKSDIFFSMQ